MGHPLSKIPAIDGQGPGFFTFDLISLSSATFDGDGRDDPCVFRAGEFLCDTAHDGGSAEAQLVFGRAGDRPLLGNLDGL